jgi:hypothetical protein
MARRAAAATLGIVLGVYLSPGSLGPLVGNAQAQPASGVITGRVTVDGIGWLGVEVRLACAPSMPRNVGGEIPKPAPPGAVQPCQKERRSVVTAANGTYEFRDVPAGSYFLSVWPDRDSPRFSGVPGVVRSLPSMRLHWVVARDGQTLRDQDFRFVSPGAINVRITNDIGRSMSGVSVRAQREIGVWSNWASADTNALGEAMLVDLPPGSYYIVAGYYEIQPLAAVRGVRLQPDRGVAQDPRTGPYSPTYYPGTSDPGSAQPIAVESRSEISVAFSLSNRRVEPRSSGKRHKVLEEVALLPIEIPVADSVTV